ncbi:MAG: 2-C-methyl-D-erythritol 2,4-cyclodiphosphate synthase [Candidatus Diapherotrites archaeon]
MSIRIGIGQDSHAFSKTPKLLVLGGAQFPGEPGLEANSDGDLVLHAILRALDSLLGTEYLGLYADKLCAEQGIKDSREYLKPALQDLQAQNARISSVSIALECKTPKIGPKKEAIRKGIAQALGIPVELVGVTAESGDGLSAFAQGNGVRCVAVIAIETPSTNT